MHLVIQLVAHEWFLAKKAARSPRWDIFPTAELSRKCQEQAAQHLDWHADLHSLDLSAYLRGLTQKKLWWIQVPEDGELQVILTLKMYSYYDFQ